MSFGFGSFLIVFAIICLSGIGLSFIAILGAILFGRGVSRRMVMILASIMGLILLLLAADRYLLPQQGLGLRRWAEGILLLLAALLFVACVVLSRRIVEEQPIGKDGLSAMVTLVSGVALLGLVFYGSIALVFGSWTDRVTEYPEGQLAIVESAGIFHDKVYRYVNPFLHGELLCEWKD